MGKHGGMGQGGGGRGTKTRKKKEEKQQKTKKKKDETKRNGKTQESNDHQGQSDPATGGKNSADASFLCFPFHPLLRTHATEGSTHTSSHCITSRAPRRFSGGGLSLIAYPSSHHPAPGIPPSSPSGDLINIAVATFKRYADGRMPQKALP